jgi:hypothetical protein
VRRLKQDDAGIALIVVMLILMLMAGLMAGFFAAVNADTRSNALDKDQTRAYAAAHAGLEKLTSDLASLFGGDVSPSVSQINALMTHPPTISGYEYRAPGGAANSGYAVTWKADAYGNPAPDDPSGSTITAGPYRGLKGIITKYPITITARSTTGGSEVRLRRELQTVAVPVFQFGIFSDGDLSIFAGDNFSFGGRVHTNGSLFVCEWTSGGGVMTFTDRITAVNEIVRKYFSNGFDTASSPTCLDNVLVPTSASTNRNLAQSPNEGSVSAMPGSTANPNWTSLSTGTYKSYIRTGLTGATRLDLPLVSQGAKPIDLIRRPALGSNEDTLNTAVFQQRYYSQASLRILLSDRVADFTTLPTITATAPIQLDGDWAGGAFPVGYGTGGLGVDATHPPIARSTGAWTAQTTNSASCCSGGTIKTSAAIAGDFALPAAASLLIGANGATTCTGKTATTFTGCNVTVAIANGAVITATTTYGAVTATVNGAVTVGNPKTITVNIPTLPAGGIAAFTTAPFTVNTFFIDGKLYTCTGYDNSPSPKQFIGCNSDTTPPNNTAITSSALANRNTGTIGGYIKIEKQNSAGVWSDVTLEILNLGIGARNQETGTGGTLCADPTPDAVIRIQRLRDNKGATTCWYPASKHSWDYWPNTLYDPREGSYRDRVATDPMMMGGVMQYISLDVANLKKWLAGTTGTTGTQAWNNNGYIVYFSDRRSNHDSGNADVETAEYGFEDVVNSTTAGGAPDGVLQTGEDVNGLNAQQLYGRTPSAIGGNIPAGAAAPYEGTLSNAAGTTGSSPWAILNDEGAARVNKVVLFRRALKLVNGASGNLPTTGLTVVAENPVYVQGNYNATSSLVATETHVPAAVISDAVTLLSNAWTDTNTFENPNSWANRTAASTTGFRFGAVTGRTLSFPYCGTTCGSPGSLYGTDGGVANLLRLAEDWSSGTLNYRGSLVALITSRQATGTYKFPNTHVYNGGTRSFTFDIDFLSPSLIPPGTPMFRDVNTLTFRQILRPTQ